MHELSDVPEIGRAYPIHVGAAGAARLADALASGACPVLDWLDLGDNNVGDVDNALSSLESALDNLDLSNLQDGSQTGAGAGLVDALSNLRTTLGDVLGGLLGQRGQRGGDLLLRHHQPQTASRVPA